MSETKSRRQRMLLAILLVILFGALVVLYEAFDLTRDPNEVKLGAKVPVVTLQNAEGQDFVLKQGRPQGYRVMVFYRGHW